jgi:hypothetical protein
MGPSLFQTLGKYAGLAGISVGVVLVIFRQLLKLKIFSTLVGSQTYRLLQQLMYLTFAIGVIGIAAWAFVTTKENSSHSITGHLIDGKTKKPVAGAEITLSGRAESAHTDGAGNFVLSFVAAPSGSIHLFISKQGYAAFDRNASVGQNIEAELLPADPLPLPAVEMTTTRETYYSDNAASGACKDFGAWASVCSPPKPAGWTITYQHFELTGDRAGCAYAICEPDGPITDTRVCYHFRTQGHDEECGHSGNTGIHYSKGVLTVVWQHPKS